MRTVVPHVLASGILGLLACREAPAPHSPRIVFENYRQVVPGPDLPSQVQINHANNNLDVIRHDGKLYFAFRTAPNHFASPETRMYVLSSGDERLWTYETHISRGRDLREPRFLSFDGRLFLYVAELGTDPTAFEPALMLATEMLGAGQWTTPTSVYQKDFIPWRTKTIDGIPYLVGYLGGENEYNLSGNPITVQVLTTRDGVTWTGVNGRPYVTQGGGSETDFAFDGEGNLYAVQRNEPGDDTGWGSKICWAGKSDITHWQCAGDPRKYDSPLMFTHKGELYVIARRHLTATGNYDLGMRDLSPKDQTATYLVDYSLHPKRCSIWRYDTKNKKIVYVTDLPSRGDTCFAGIAPLSENAYTIFNYTSPLQGNDISWLEGQLGDTIIYSGTLTFAD